MSSYSDFANAASDIELKKGDVLARGKAQSGELWGSTIANLGQVIPQQVQQVMQQVAAKKKTAHIQSILQQNGGDLDKALPQIMGIDPTLGQKLAKDYAEVQKSVAEVTKIKQDAEKAKLEFSDRLWSQVHDEDSYARAALVSHRLGEEVPPQFDPTWVEGKKKSLMTLKDQFEHAKPPEPFTLSPGQKRFSPTGEVLAEVEKPPSESGFTLAPGAIRYDAQGNKIAESPKDTSLTPYQQEELKRRDRDFALAQQRFALAVKQANKPAIVQQASNMADAIMAHPELFAQLTATGKEKVIPELEKRGFTDFKKPPSATMENRLASAKAVVQTGDDITAQLKDPKIAAMLGPAMGRYNNLREFLGNPPPELSELSGNIGSFALAQMGVHGMRNAEMAKQIEQMLDAKHTPESLAARIAGINKFANHLLENEGRSATTGTTAGTPVTGYDVKAPNGKTYHFKTQGEAAGFKARAGIK